MAKIKKLKKGNKDEKKTKSKHKNKKRDNSNNAVLSNSNKARPIKVKEYYTWKDLEKIPYATQQQLVNIFIKRAEGAEAQYGFMPYPVIPMKIKGVKRPVPLYYNHQLNCFDIANKVTYNAAVSQRRLHHSKIEHLEGYKQYIRDINGQFGGMSNSYDPEVHPARLKEIAKKVDLEDHWCKHLGVDRKTMKSWAKAFKEFGDVYYKYKGKITRNIEKSIIKAQTKGYKAKWKDEEGAEWNMPSPTEKAKILSLLKKSQRWDDSHKAMEVQARIDTIKLDTNSFTETEADNPDSPVEENEIFDNVK